MEAKDLRYHALITERDWYPDGGAGPWGKTELLWDTERGGLSLRPQFLGAVGGTHAAGEIRPGGARDAEGYWYWIDPAGGRILMVGKAGGVPLVFWPVAAQAVRRLGAFGPAAPAGSDLDLRGLVVTATHLLVVGSVSPPGLFIFDLLHGGEPRFLALPAGSWPVDLSAAPDGSVAVLDAGAQVRYWLFDPFLRPAASPGGAICHEVAEDRALAIQLLPDGGVLVLAAGDGGKPATVTRYRGGQRLGSSSVAVPASAVDEPQGNGPFYPEPYDMVSLGETLYVAAADIREALAFTIDLADDRLRLTPRLIYLPMVGDQLLGLAVAGGEVFYGTPTGWTRLAERPCPRYPARGSVTVRGLNGMQQGCVWHRVLLDAIIPPGAAVLVETRAADEPELPDTIPWSREPDPHLRPTGSELPWYRPFEPDEAGQPGAGTWELLLQHAHGRFLQIRLTLASSGGAAPLVRAVRVYYPRLSYVNEYLPQAYRGDAASDLFLERFLANMEGLHSDLFRQMEAVHTLFTPDTAPPEYLEWLAGWYGQTLDEGWSEQRRRLFLRHAPVIFARRGTLPNLVRLIRLATDPEPGDAIFSESVLPYTGLPVPGRRPTGSFRIVEGFWGPAVGLEYGMEAAAVRDGTVIREYREFARNWRRINGMDAPPPGSASLREQFVDTMLPEVLGAHRFTVLVPVVIDRDGVRPAIDVKAVAAVVRREQPAHTSAEIRPYLPVMRAGEARVGVDAVVGLGSRLTAMALGSGVLGERYVAPDRRPVSSERVVVGENQLAFGYFRR
ncbi:MAG TPA: phage tail protein [Symbiobacteriaceae bacterium]|nr:phage tail protein [Symbiobacteriaceae bacterium]